MTSTPRDDDRQAAADPVLARRRQMARGALLAQRVGYAVNAADRDDRERGLTR